MNMDELESRLLFLTSWTRGTLLYDPNVRTRKCKCASGCHQTTTVVLNNEDLLPVQLKSSLRDALIATGMLQTRFRRPKGASPTEDKGVPIGCSAFDLIENRKEDPCSEGVI
jgi:hypothetical protein